MDEDELKNTPEQESAPEIIASPVAEVSDATVNRPKLKKIKRPVRRNEGDAHEYSGGANLPISPRTNNNSFNDTSNADSYLDNHNAIQNAPRFVEESDLNTESGSGSSFMIGNMFTKKAVGLIAVGVFVLGFLFAKIFFTQETVVKDGLQDVVVNPEVPRGRPRCGLAEKTQGCVLYLMNPQRQELNARDFYDLAAQLTGRQRFVIETGNMRYSGVKIRPGEIAQLNIPPLQ